MAFMMKKKRYKFQADLCLDELTEVSYSKAILFAKIRQLDGGSFTDVSRRMEVQNHCVKYSARFSFPCKMNANANSGILETCKCRISIRMEERGGRHFRKLGFVDVNLAEYAGAGPSTQRYILQPYESNHRLDNSIVQLTVNITLREGDTIFQRPLTRQQPILLPGEENRHKVPAGPSISGGGANTPPTGTVPPTSGSPMQTASATVMTVSMASSDRDQRPWVAAQRAAGGVINSGRISFNGNSDLVNKTDDLMVDPASHTRNSSTTSQFSKGSGYESQNSQPILNGPNLGHVVEKGKGALGPGITEGHSRQSSSGGDSNYGRNLSQGSSDTGFFGSMEKEKRRREALGEGRVDAEAVISELLEGVDLDKAVQEDDAESSGLQLYVGKDGTVTFDKNSSRLTNDFQPVVIDGPR